MSNIILPILFFLSLFSLLYMVFKKVPAMAQIPLESLENKESFFGFLWRLVKTFFGYFHPRKIKIYFLSIAEKILLRFKDSVTRTQRNLEDLSRHVRATSQKEKWEHHWFSSKDNKKKKEENSVKDEELLEGSAEEK